MSLVSLRPPYNYYGIENPNFKKSRVVIFPVPYEGTVSYQHGTSLGPQAIITASRQVELYDIELKQDISKLPVYTLPELEPSTDSPAQVINMVQHVTAKNAQYGKFQITLGGEHSITLGAVRGYQRKYNDLSILQLDAHTDLREKYEGSRYNHACVMKRCREVVSNVVQCGIRSQCAEEARAISTRRWQHDVFYGSPPPFEAVLGRLTKHVYLTIDLDVLDPSFMHATGTPEPGGWTWDDLMSTLRFVFRSCNVVGADVVELAPIPGVAAPDFIAAKIVHKLICYKSYPKRIPKGA